MFPIKDKDQYKLGYKFGQPTFYSGFHVGLDIICPEGTPVYAPFDGMIDLVTTAPQGGKTLRFRPDHDNVAMRFMHLSEFKKGLGKVKVGDVIGLVGNTGLSRGAHLHLDISKKAVDITNPKNFIDPEKYDWNYMSQFVMRMCVFMNYENRWTNPFTEFLNLIEKDTKGKMRIELWPLYTKFTDFDPVFEGTNPLDQYGVPSRKIYNEYIKTHGFGNPHAYALSIPTATWKERPFGKPDDIEKGWYYMPNTIPGDTSHLPNKIFMICDEQERGIYYPEWSAFTEILYHELGHLVSHNGHPSRFDFTHTLHATRQIEKIWDQIDFSLLSRNLTT